MVVECCHSGTPCCDRGQRKRLSLHRAVAISVQVSKESVAIGWNPGEPFYLVFLCALTKHGTIKKRLKQRGHRTVIRTLSTPLSAAKYLSRRERRERYRVPVLSLPLPTVFCCSEKCALEAFPLHF